MNRRNVLRTLAAVGATFGLGIACVRAAAAESKPRVSKLMKSKDEWKKLLSREQYQVLFEEDTERPGTSP
ncbi:MAG: peptide-methionine (R)-S-oxide reductase MsrB, partial [Gammaproteobacteria bacterium]